MKAVKYILVFSMLMFILLVAVSGCDDDDDDGDDNEQSLCPVKPATLYRVDDANIDHDCTNLGVTFIFEGFYYSESDNLYGLKGQYSIQNDSTYYLKGELEDQDDECYESISRAGIFEVFAQYSEQADSVEFEIVSATTFKALPFCKIDIIMND